MRRPLLPAFPVVLLVCLVLACSGDDGTAPVVPEDGTLENVTLSLSSATSLDKVRLNGMPAAKRDSVYTARILAGGESFEGLIVDHDEEGYFLYAPLHPQTPNEGGSLEIQVVSGDEASPPLPLEVEALPESPGSYEAVVDALRAHIEQRAQAAGTSFEALAAESFDSIDPVLFSLKLAQTYVDADHPNDMASFVANENGFLSDDERELLDRIFGYAPLQEVVRYDIDNYAANKLAPWRLSSGNSGSNASLQTSGSSVEKRACIDASPDISSAGELSQAMLRASLAEIAIDPNSAPGRTLSALGTVLTGGGFIPGVGLAFSVAGMSLAAWQASREFYSGVYPSRFVELTFDYDPPLFNEDETEPGRWDNVKVKAAADGWAAERAIVNVVTTALGAYVSGAMDTGIQSLDVLDVAAMTGLNVSLDAYLEQQGTEIIEFCAGDWTVDITGTPWSTAGVLNHRFDVDVETREVRPADVGVDFLVVAAQANQFGGHTVQDDVQIETQQIQVVLGQTQYFVENPGDTIQIAATIQNATRTWLTWSNEKGSFLDGLGAQTNDSATRPLKTPTNASDYPFDVVVESASRQGLRASGEPPRRAVATVRSEVRVMIEPPFECISPGQTQQFTAQVAGLEQYTVLWSVAEGWGSIDQNGLYQAPPTGSTSDKIKAEVEGRPDAFNYAYVEVGECNCLMKLTTSTGISDAEYGSSQIAFLRSFFDPMYFYQFFIQMEDENIHLGASIMGSEAVPPPAPGELGTYDAGFSLIFGSSDSWTSYVDDEQGSSVTVIITEHTVDRMVGVFVGDVVKFDQQGGIAASIGIRMEFRAGYWAGGGGGWPCN